jgi:hypothetical protein
MDGLKEAVQALHDSGRGRAVSLTEVFSGAERAGKVEVAEWLRFRLPYQLKQLPGVDAADGVDGVDDRPARLCRCFRWLLTAAAAPALAGLAHTRTRRHAGSADAGHTRSGRSSPRAGCMLRASPRTVLSFEVFAARPHQPAADAADFLTFEAVRLGDLHLLLVLVEECGAHGMENTCVAAEGGRMPVLPWATSKHCPCAADTWCAAVRRGGKRNDFRPLTLPHSTRRLWTEAVWAAAVLYEEVRAWLKERGCPGSQAASVAGAGAGAGAGPGWELPLREYREDGRLQSGAVRRRMRMTQASHGG